MGKANQSLDRLVRNNYHRKMNIQFTSEKGREILMEDSIQLTIHRLLKK